MHLLQGKERAYGTCWRWWGTACATEAVQWFAQEPLRAPQVEIWLQVICLCGRNCFTQSASSYLGRAGSCTRTWEKPCGGECRVATMMMYR